MSGKITRYIARQPILDRDLHTVGYELLHRNGVSNRAVFADQELASLTTIDTALLLGFKALCGHGRAFVNCTTELLEKDRLRSLPPGSLVIELTSEVEPEPKVREVLLSLRKAGYTLAIDDFVLDSDRERLADIGSILKVDVRKTSCIERKSIVDRWGSTHELLAQKVETREEYHEAMDLGFDLFQGYFFQEPEIITTTDLTPNMALYAQLFAAVHAPDINFQHLEELIKSDPALCYRLLRYLNSAIFCRKSSVTSIRHALALLGEREVKTWVSLITLVCASTPDELTKSALLRAHLAGELATRAQCREYEAFLCGLFSLMHSILGISMAELLSKVELPTEVSHSLITQSGRLFTLVELIKAYDSGHWDEADRLSASLNIEETLVAAEYNDSVQWVESIMSLR